MTLTTRIRPLVAFAIAAVVCVGPAPLRAQAAPRLAGTLTATEMQELSRVRASVWSDWFSGDTAALRRVLAPELVAMGIGSPGWQSLAETIAASADYKRRGGKFVSAHFDDNTVHRFGAVVVMFSRYTVVTAEQGKQSTMKGRATEVFVRDGNRWVHTSWQLDQAP